MTLICLKIKLHADITSIWKVSHLDSFWNRGPRELRNGLMSHMFINKACTNQSEVGYFQTSHYQIFSGLLISHLVKGNKDSVYKVEITGKIVGCKTIRKSKSAIQCMVQRWRACVPVPLWVCTRPFVASLSHHLVESIPVKRKINITVTILSFSQVHVAFNSIKLKRDHAKQAVFDFCTPNKLPLLPPTPVP